MDLRDYERIKFEMADLIRSAALADPAGKEDRDAAPWHHLLTRLAEDRFTVVVAGRFSRGKSSLVNAILGLDRLPTGIVPLTSVITSVRYGTSEKVVLEYLGIGLRGEARLEDLGDWVTERGNPGNVKRLRAAEIQLPAEILRRGFFLVDTPGLGSAILENAETTRSFIPEIDVLLLVTGFEGPLSEDELRFLDEAAGAARAVLVAINKKDATPLPARREVEAYVEARVRARLGGARVFSVSAQNGLAARQAGDDAAFRESGIEELEAELVRLAVCERARLVLAATCDRVRSELASLPAPERAGLQTRLDSLSSRIGAWPDPSDRGTGERPASTSSAGTPAPFGGCEICRRVLDGQFAFLSRYQFELAASPGERERHAERGGFCSLHTWHYEQVASPRGVCSAYPPVLTRLAGRLRSLAAGEVRGDAPRPAGPDCPVCALRRLIEDPLIESALARAAGPPGVPLPSLCLPHLRTALERSRDASVRGRLLAAQAAWLERLAEDMQRYGLKSDGLRRGLASDEERDSPLQALETLAGARNVNAVAAVRDLL